MSDIIECSFSLFNEGRKYTGHHRKYILENAKQICYSPATREKIALNEALGYFGHGRREFAGKVRINEVEKIMENGKPMIVENVPSNVTIAFDVLDDGTVNHKQRILESAPGQIVAGLNKSKVGGFSWACAGSDGGRKGATVLTSFEGFDYVMNPGFSGNRGYVLESASAETRDMILESICQTGIEDKEAEMILESWLASAQWRAFELENKLADAEIYSADMCDTLDRLKTEVSQAQDTISVYESAEQARKRLVSESCGKYHIVIPVDVADAMISMSSEADFHKVVGFFESAYTAELAALPLGRKIKAIQPAKKVKQNDDRLRGYDFTAPFRFGQ